KLRAAESVSLHFDVAGVPKGNRDVPNVWVYLTPLELLLVGGYAVVGNFVHTTSQATWCSLQCCRDYISFVRSKVAPMNCQLQPLRLLRRADEDTRTLWADKMRQRLTFDAAVEACESKVAAVWLFANANDVAAARETLGRADSESEGFKPATDKKTKNLKMTKKNDGSTKGRVPLPRGVFASAAGADEASSGLGTQPVVIPAAQPSEPLHTNFVARSAEAASVCRNTAAQAQLPQPPGDWMHPVVPPQPGVPSQSPSNWQPAVAEAALPCSSALDRLRRKAAAGLSLTLLVFSICDGIGAAWLALDATLFQVVQMSFETHPACMSVLRHRFPSLRHCGSARSISEHWLREAVERHRPDACLLKGSGQFTHLNPERVVGRSNHFAPFWSFVECRDLLSGVLRAHSVPLFFLFVNGVRCSMEAWLSWDPGRSNWDMCVPRGFSQLVPLSNVFKGGWWPTHLAKSATKLHPEGRFVAMCKPLRPGAKPHGWTAASNEAQIRCRESSVRLPTYHFEDRNLLFRESQWRLLSCRERELLMGFPADFTRVPSNGKQVLPDPDRLCTICSSTHVPLLRMLLASLAGFCGLQPATGSTCPVPVVTGAPSPQPDPVIDMWGLTGRAFVNAYLKCLPEPLRSISLPFESMFDGPDSGRNEYYAARMASGHQHGGLLVFDFREQSSAFAFAAAAGEQRGTHLSREGWPRLVPEGLGLQRRLQAARAVESHPFTLPPNLPDDLLFVVQATASQKDLGARRRRRIRRWRAKSKALEALTHAAWRAMSPRVRAVAGTLNIGLMLYLSVLLAWPDTSYVARLITGFTVVGVIEDAPVFRPAVAQTQKIAREELLATSATYIDHLEATMGPNADPEVDWECLRQCEKDLARGGAAGFTSRAALDSKYGKGNWRPLPRFVIWQERSMKYRAIDNGRSAGHNSASSTKTRVRTAGHDLVVAVSHAVWLLRDQIAEKIGRNVNLEGPEFQTAICRQLLSMLCVHYYDDNLTLGLSSERGSGQQTYNDLCGLLGVKLDRTKRTLMNPIFVYTGAVFDFGRLLPESLVKVDAKNGRRESILSLVAEHRRSKWMSSGQASTLRGKCGFLDSQIHGKVLKQCERPLIARQYHDTVRSLGPVLDSALQFLECVLAKVKARQVQFGPQEAFTIVYTDAMWEPGQPCGLGLVIHSPRRSKPLGLAAIVPDAVVRMLVPKDTQIGQAEVLAALLGPHNLPELYRNADILHFVDNQSALSGLIKGVSPKEDTAAILSVYTIMVAQLGSKVWYELCESSANMSHGLSRDGLLDPVAKQFGIDAQYACLPTLPSFSH
ncbi:unnamed protein product, partial [Polarella glacialis]